MARRAASKYLVSMPAVALVAVSVLAGCGGGATDNAGGAGKAGGTASSSAAAPSAAAPAAASANGATDPSKLKPVKLIWYFLGTKDGDYAQVYAKANEIIQKKINATVDFEPMSNADYKQKMPLKMASGEKFDLAYLTDNANILSYRDAVSKGAFIPLDDLIAKYAPQTKKSMPDNIWAAPIINGKTYAVPNYQISARTPGLMFNKALVDKYNLKDKIMAVKKMSDLTPIFEIIKKNEPNIYETNVPPSHVALDVHDKSQFVENVDISIPVDVNYDLKVLDRTQGQGLQDMLDDAKLAREWNQKGYFHPDIALSKDLTPDQRAGKIFVTRDNAKPGVVADYKKKFGYDTYVVPMGMPVLSTASINATLTGISRTSDNPERAMMLLELMNTDVELYNLLVFGIEGVDYKKTGPNRVEPLGTKYTGTAWAIGNQFNAYLLPGQDDDVWDQTKKVNATAVPAPTIGFSFDSKPVQTEYANLLAVGKKYFNTFQVGVTDNYQDTIAKYNQELKAAGLDKYEAELQKQLDAWKATKK